MDISTEDFIEKQKLLEKELEKYKDAKLASKEYMQSMDDISEWLKGISK